jgi:hypothetical protein
VRARPDVQAVIVGITEDMGDDDWPFSDSVYVLTSATARSSRPEAHRLGAGA